MSCKRSKMERIEGNMLSCKKEAKNKKMKRVKLILIVALWVNVFLANGQTTYVDSTFHYQVEIPTWLTVRSSGDPHFWGGTLPAVEGIENAILIKSFEKSKYATLAEFKKFIVEDMVFGQAPNWSNAHICMGKKELGKLEKLGDAYKVYLMQNALIYHCEYVLLETPTGYLWIDFTATKETFDKNFDKFKKLMKGFKVLK
jgi:hypothetical protein